MALSARNDCWQAAVGMACDERGLALVLAHHVFEGNIAESKNTRPHA